jgi:hypothetical protein
MATNLQEKASEILKMRVTPTQKQAFKEVANGNLSRWAKATLTRVAQMANARRK